MFRRYICIYTVYGSYTYVKVLDGGKLFMNLIFENCKVKSRENKLQTLIRN